VGKTAKKQRFQIFFMKNENIDEVRVPEWVKFVMSCVQVHQPALRKYMLKEKTEETKTPEWVKFVMSCVQARQPAHKKA
jgi:hypothetical protein